MKKSCVAFLLILLLALEGVIFSSCSQKEESGLTREVKAGEKLKLRFMSSWGGVDSKAGTLQQVLDRFTENNPDIEVINESLFGEDFLPKIKTDFASGNDPDVFGLWPGSDIKALIKAGKVADLTDIISGDKEWNGTFDKQGWNYTTFDGKIYGLPVEIIFEGLFVNTDLFDKYNVSVPRSFDGLKRAVEVFKENGIIPIAYNYMAEGTFLYQNIVAVLGSEQDVENPFKDGKVNQCYIDAMYYMRELYQMKAFPQNAFSLSNAERNALFKEKKAAMIVQGSWFIGDFTEDGGNVDIVQFPGMQNTGPYPSTLIYGLGCGAFQMSSTAWDDSSKREASLRLLRTLTSRNTAAFFAQQTGMISNIDICGYNVSYNRLTKKGLQLINNAQVLVGPPDSFVDRSVWERVIVEDFPYMLEGEVSPEEIWNKAINEGIATD